MPFRDPVGSTYTPTGTCSPHQDPRRRLARPRVYGREADTLATCFEDICAGHTAASPSDLPPDILQSVSPKQSGHVPQPRARVLIIDDEPSLRIVLLLALEDLFQVVTAATGGEGLTRLQHDPISIVLLDLHLPDLDGFEVLQRIRAFDPQIIVFILTGDPDPTIVTRAKLLGAVGVLLKPWDIDALRTQLWQTWEHTRCRLL
jgi:CheY-like chemotaxis protein